MAEEARMTVDELIGKLMDVEHRDVVRDFPARFRMGRVGLEPTTDGL